MSSINKHLYPGSIDKHTPDIDADTFETNSATIGDDETWTFGDDDDYSLVYDSTNDRWEIRDAGAGNDVIRIDANQNVSVVNGNLTATAGSVHITNGSGTSLPGTSTDGELRLFDDTDATDPSGRLQAQMNGTTFTWNADAGKTYRDLGAYDKTHDNTTVRSHLDETQCFECDTPFEEGDRMMQVVNDRRTVDDAFDEIHTVPLCISCLILPVKYRPQTWVRRIWNAVGW